MVKINEDFKPDPALKTLYKLYGGIVFGFVLALALFMFAVGAPAGVPYTFMAASALVMIPVLYWIPLYWESISYKLGERELTCRRGVWFKKKSSVPYSKVTNTDLKQGPLSRALGISSLVIQTAGYSSPNASSAEIKLEGLEEPEELEDQLMELVRGSRGAPAGGKDPVLKELIRIRKAVEK